MRSSPLVALSVLACRSVSPGSDATGVPAPSASIERPTSIELPDAASEDADSTKLAPLAAGGALISLEVEGYRDAIVSIPSGATGPRPVVVALHGNYDRPEWQCDVWRQITAGFPFVLCPRGTPRSDAPKSEDRWTYGGLDATEKELDAALDALRERFPKYVDPGPGIYTGFSLGAIYGKLIARKRATDFPRAVFVEGGYEGWSMEKAKSFAKAGGARVLFACGQAACVHASKSVAGWLEKAEVPARVVSGGNVGHTYDGPVQKAIAGEWSWLTAGDARFPAETQGH